MILSVAWPAFWDVPGEENPGRAPTAFRTRSASDGPLTDPRKSVKGGPDRKVVAQPEAPRLPGFAGLRRGEPAPPWRACLAVAGAQGSERAVTSVSQPRIDRLALHGQHAEDALVNAPERLAPDESLQGLDAQGELAESQSSLGGQAA